MYKYDATDKCNGCIIVTGEVTFQCGQKRMIALMKDDSQDKHRARSWRIEKAIDIPEAPEAPLETQRRAPEEPVASSSTTQPNCSKARANVSGRKEKKIATDASTRNLDHAAAPSFV